MARIRIILFLLMPLVLLPTAAGAQFSLNKLKKSVDTATKVKDEVDRFTFSEQEEVELGLAISRRIIGRYGVARDFAATHYLSLVGAALAADSGRPSLPWKWIILDSDAVNAFAAPGGYVHITRGALAVISSEAELAGVLAHEAAHIVEKHTLDDLQKSMGTELAQDQASFTVGSALFEAVADKAAEAVLAGFGRGEEIEADEVGVEIASRVGYSTDGLSTFLAKLDAMQAGAQTTSILYRSHPETQERIERIEKWTKKKDLEGSVWLAERYDREITFEVASSTTGTAIAGAHGVAGGSAAESEGESATESDEENVSAESNESSAEGEKKGFSLTKLTNPFGMGKQQETAEVTGAGAGRAVGEETGETESGPKEIEPLDIEISDEELQAFLEEGGLE